MIHLLQLIHKPLNIVSDFTHVVGLFPTHTCTHSNLPRFIAEGNKQTNALACPTFTSPDLPGQAINDNGGG